MKRPKVYICGPFRALDGYGVKRNVDRAEQVALDVLSLGCIAVCPHTMYANFNGLLYDRFWLEATEQLMLDCDAVMVVDSPYLGGSVGSRNEMRVAEEHGIPIFFLLHKLEVWQRGFISE